MSESHPDGGAWPRPIGPTEEVTDRLVPPRAEHVLYPGDPIPEDLRCVRRAPHAPHRHEFGHDMYGGYLCTGDGSVPVVSESRVALNDARPGGMLGAPARTPLTGVEAALVAVIALGLMALVAFVVWRLT